MRCSEAEVSVISQGREDVRRCRGDTLSVLSFLTSSIVVQHELFSGRHRMDVSLMRF
jgi:hypothetical protein